ncbi:hypothetical protein [Blastopirellula marina]|uniref:Uncharacterized protein n=1 Tax=Blastopirellula marina TaxID=124 RepID=A0A2S8GP71_9BACT|nr:hypothetical protein [Blastopirellula marina]PQO46228.1 hypothetical protein C5Y93_09585 [Blastopirellula marina]
MHEPNSDNPFASPQTIEPEEQERDSPRPAESDFFPITVVFAVLGCSTVGMLAVIVGQVIHYGGLVFTGWIGVCLGMTLFFPFRWIWYVAIGYFVLLLLMVALITTSPNFLGLFPALLSAIVVLLMTLPSSRRYYGIRT